MAAGARRLAFVSRVHRARRPGTLPPRPGPRPSGATPKRPSVLPPAARRAPRYPWLGLRLCAARRRVGRGGRYPCGGRRRGVSRGARDSRGRPVGGGRRQAKNGRKWRYHGSASAGPGGRRASPPSRRRRRSRGAAGPDLRRHQRPGGVPVSPAPRARGPARRVSSDVALSHRRRPLAARSDPGTVVFAAAPPKDVGRVAPPLPPTAPPVGAGTLGACVGEGGGREPAGDAAGGGAARGGRAGEGPRGRWEKRTRRGKRGRKRNGSGRRRKQKGEARHLEKRQREAAYKEGRRRRKERRADGKGGDRPSGEVRDGGLDHRESSFATEPRLVPTKSPGADPADQARTSWERGGWGWGARVGWLEVCDQRLPCLGRERETWEIH